MVKAIVMDMDGTLLNENSEIPQKTKEALLQLERQGVCIVLASGRSVFRLQPIIEELQLKTFGGYCIEINGMAYVDLQKNERNVLRRMDHKDACELFEYCKKTDAEVMVFYDDGLFDYHSARIHAIKEELRRQKQLPADYPW
ncbi:MAG: HAD family phosphatase, partial [Erysipelotrichaceae bacterium]|nr:HAD family phosphatase [Erysipelotrichaceae bacterium]